MARLQDFQTVTPTASDKLLVVQSQGQGLTTIGDFKSDKMDKANPTGTGSLSLNRKSGTTTGTNSVAVGTNCTASGNMSCAIGDTNTASGAQSFSVGAANTASGERSAAIGSNASASGSRSIAMGQGTIAQRKAQHVFGEYNIADTTGADGTVRGSYVEIVGKGTADNARSNARTLDWSGNEFLAGDLTFSGAISLANMNKVIESDRQYVIQSGTLNANSYGYIEVSVNVPSGYKTTGLISIYLGHPAAAGGLQLCGGIRKKQTGTITIYLSYFTPVAIAAANTDFFVNIGIINSNVNID